MLLHSQSISYFNVKRTIWLKARSTLGVQNFFRPRTSVDKRLHLAILHYERTGVVM